MSTQAGYFGLSLVYGLVAICVLLTPVVFVNYRVTFQSGLMAAFLACCGILWSALRPDPVTRRVHRPPRIMFCVASFVSLFLLGVALINPIQYLASECPAVSSAAAASSLDLTLEYARYDAKTGTVRPELLLMQYNMTHRRITRRLSTKHSLANGNKPHTWLESAVKSYQAQQTVVCSDEPISRFRYLEHDVEHELHDERQSIRRAVPLMRMSSVPDGDDNGYEVLKQKRHLLDMQEVCNYEYEAAIAYIIFIFVLFILEFFTLLWYCFMVKDAYFTYTQAESVK